MTTYTTTRHIDETTITLTIETDALDDDDRALLREALGFPTETEPAPLYRNPYAVALDDYDRRRHAGEHADALRAALTECFVLRENRLGDIADAAYAFAGTQPHTMRHGEACEVLAYIRAALVAYPNTPDPRHIHVDYSPEP